MLQPAPTAEQLVVNFPHRCGDVAFYLLKKLIQNYIFPTGVGMLRVIAEEILRRENFPHRRGDAAFEFEVIVFF